MVINSTILPTFISFHFTVKKSVPFLFIISMDWLTLILFNGLKPLSLFLFLCLDYPVLSYICFNLASSHWPYVSF